MRRFSFLLSTVRSSSRFYSNRVGAVSAGNPFRVFHFQENASFISRQQNSYFSSSFNSDPVPFSSTIYKENKESERLEVEIISKENIKPTAPTPHHLKSYEVSIFDQIYPKNLYTSFVYYYQNNHINNHDLISKRRHILKQSLSEILTKFYPLAGKVHDRHIDCNDDGVYYVEAKVNDCLTDVIDQPDNKSIHQLLPFDPLSSELLSQTYAVMVQVTIFSCGGIAVGIYTSQKIIDGYSLITFLVAWAATASGEISEQINPNFTSPLIFPPISTLPDSKRMIIPMTQERRRNCTTRRFLFSASSLISLKKEAGPSSTHVMAVTGLIWKCAIEASRKLRPSTSKHHAMLFPIDLRSKNSPPLPPYCIGNMAITTNSICARNEDAGLHSLVEKLKNEDDQVDSEFIEKLKGEEGSRNIEGLLLNEVDYDRNKDVEITSVTNMCNGMMYEINFGWGRPVYVSVGDGESYAPSMKNSVILMDTIYRDEIEAWVTLSEDDMTVFE
ncbi:hypothetical protein ACJIZ3_013673 [Penstemon smallii]|uniref:Transferase, Chloramphenicol acetyltransferase-like domain protein n=1 Tax=Penstemon smallii TaxID=265156 RepID=A0ABD3RH99_9LAMI